MYALRGQDFYVLAYTYTKRFFSAGAVYNQLYSKLSTNQKQSYICKSAFYAH